MSPVFGHGRLRLYLLKLLDESPRHGYDVIAGLEDRFMGLYAPSAGTVYPRLARLEEEGLVTHDDEGGRKVYRLTDAGREELIARGDELDDLESEIASSVRHLAREVREDVRGSVRDLRSELKAAAREVRREERSRARTVDPHLHELTQLLDGLRRDVVGVGRRAPITDDQLRRCRGVVRQLRNQLFDVLGAGQ